MCAELSAPLPRFARSACISGLIPPAPQPCLKPDVFNPTDLNAEDWMAASAAMGMREIIITAHHEVLKCCSRSCLEIASNCSHRAPVAQGGFALWPSKHTPYSVAASSWKGGKGDVLREFADAANKWGIRIGYYLNVQDDGYMNLVANYTCEDFIKRQVGMVTEVLTEYGPVNRFWFDGTSSNPCATTTQLWDQVYKTIRTVSPWTMITAYRGDVCAAKNGQTLYTNDGPPPNSTDPSGIDEPLPQMLCRAALRCAALCCAVLCCALSTFLPACMPAYPRVYTYSLCLHISHLDCGAQAVNPRT